MSYVLKALSYNPIGLWEFTSATGEDRSGKSNHLTIIGTPETHFPLISGSTSARCFTTTSFAMADSELNGSPNQPFTIMAAVKVIEDSDTLTSQGVMGSLSEFDGIYLVGSEVRFRVSLEGGADYEVSAPRPLHRAFHVAGVFSGSSISIFVDGYMASTVFIEAEDANRVVESFSSGWQFGYGGTNNLVIQGAAVYAKALKEEFIYYISRECVWFDDVNPYTGSRENDISIGRLDLNVGVRHTWAGSDDWRSGEMVSVFVEGDALTSEAEMPEGHWIGSVILDPSEEFEVQSILVKYDGNVNLEISIDEGETWTPQPNNQRMVGVPSETDIAGAIFMVKAVFPEGEFRYLNFIELTVYTSASFDTENSRRSTLNPESTVRRPENPLLFDDNYGSTFTESLTISLDDAPDTGTGSVEIWVKVESGTLSITPTPDDVYVNGLPAALTTLGVKKWNLVHFNYDSPVASDIVISGNATVGYLMAKQGSASSSSVEASFRSYTNTNVSIIDETSPIELAESSDGWLIYSYDWSTV